MTTVAVASPLERNLEALGPLHADLAERLRQTPPAGSLLFGEPAQGVPTATMDGRLLCSRRRPLDEARRLVDPIDLAEHAVVVVMGFGLGYHVQRLAERLDRTGVIVVFEPDLGLLRGAVLEQLDHSSWLRDALVVWVTDADDRAALARRLHGTESIIAQGVHLLEHPASSRRLDGEAARFSRLFGEFVTAARTTLLTTLVRSVETVRNLLLNIDHYAAGAGVAELAGAAAGHPAIVVAAGPSLHRQLERLADPDVRDRCVIIAVQTTLQPLLAAGVRPHFVTALDYHEISQRFYERLGRHDLDTVTLVAEPKAHPIILDSYPGPRRCCASGFLDKVLGDHAIDMGTLPAGATVAHLGLYLARHLGCDPVILTGQDLGFTDGLYYAPGTAIDDVWAPELNPFNTIEMMQWQRIVRHRSHLQKMTDQRGRPIYTDAQMLTYLQQFERDFSAFRDEGFTIIDATEGGVVKQHVETTTLEDAIRRHAAGPLPDLPVPPRSLDPQRIEEARTRIGALRQEIEALRDVSQRTHRLLGTMIEEQQDAKRMEKHFKRLERYRAEVSRRFDAFELLNQINQLGVYKRHRADRRLHVQQSLAPHEHQLAQLERDRINVDWLGDAAEELIEQLDAASRVLDGEAVMPRSAPKSPSVSAATPAPESRVAALVAIDPQRGGLGQPRTLDATLHGTNVVQSTLQRLSGCRLLESIVLIAPRSMDLDALIDRDAIALKVYVERTDGSPFGVEQSAVAAARAWAPTCWRGGIGGMSVYDEVLCPTVMTPIMARHELSAALLVGPDWPLVDPQTCDAVIERHLEHPEQHRIVFTQAPPGLCGCVVSASLMEELVARNRLCTIGSLLVYQPRTPQADPIAKAANVQLPFRVRGAMLRAVADGPETLRRLELATAAAPSDLDLSGLVARLNRETRCAPTALPSHLLLELTTRRDRLGRFHRSRLAGRDSDMPLDMALSLVEQLAEASPVALTLDGAGDPLLHPDVHRIVAAAREAGIVHVHVRTEGRADPATLDRLLDAGVAVVSIDLHADRAATYREMMGDDGFGEALRQLERLVDRRGPSGSAALALPWIVPRLQRCATTTPDLETFFDRWQHQIGVALIEGPPDDAPADDAALLAAVTPPSAIWHQLGSRMTVLCDGSVPIRETDRDGRSVVGNVADESVASLWSALLEARQNLRDRGR